ncbi:hypothetical protein DRP05_11840 [Archaeoglobales archaeon]|nr:MAG: hypothetical protein DRP05_11840 [Archaeoglobales archaeon]
MDRVEKLSKESRERILQALVSGAKSWKETKELAKLADATLAKHIKALLEEGLITEEIDRKDRRRKIYRLSDRGLEPLKESFLALLIFFEIVKMYSHARFKWIELWTQEVKKYKSGETSILPLTNRDEREAKFIIDEMKNGLCGLFLEATFRGDNYLRALLKALDMFQTLIENDLIFGEDRTYPFKYAAIQVLDSKLTNLDSLPDTEKISRIETKLEQILTFNLGNIKMYDQVINKIEGPEERKFFETLKKLSEMRFESLLNALKKVEDPILKGVINIALKRAKENVNPLRS